MEYISVMAGVVFLADVLYLAFIWMLFAVLSREVAWLSLLGVSVGLQLFNTYLSGLSIWDVSQLSTNQANMPDSSRYTNSMLVNGVCGVSVWAGYYLGNKCYKRLARSEVSAWEIFRGCPRALKVAWSCDGASAERFEKFQRLHRRKERMSEAQETSFSLTSAEKALIPECPGTPEAQFYQKMIRPAGLAAAALPLVPKVVLDVMAIVLDIIPGDSFYHSTTWMSFWAAGMGFTIPLTFWAWVAVINLHNFLFSEATLDGLEMV